MLTFAAVATAALSPAITLPVIAGLILALALTIAYDKKILRDRLHVQRVQLGKVSGALLASFAKVAERNAERRVNKAIEFTYDTLKGIGFDKLARHEGSLDDVIFGAQPDPFKGFSLDELKEALHPDARFTTLDEELKVRDHEKRMSQEGVGDGGTTFKSVSEKQRASGTDPIRRGIRTLNQQKEAPTTPARDRLDSTEIEVTREMEEEGASVIEELKDVISASGLAARVYIAMTVAAIRATHDLE